MGVYQSEGDSHCTGHRENGYCNSISLLSAGKFFSCVCMDSLLCVSAMQLQPLGLECIYSSLHRFRKFNGDVTLKNRPSEPQKTGLVSDKCGGLTKWAVITTIAPDTTETMTVLLEKAPEFCLLVVGDRKSPDTYPLKSHQDRCIYLTIDNQLTLSLDIISLTPENSFSRKNIGFLYAIANGAKVILDMDDDNVPIELGGKFFPMIEEVGTFTSWM